MPSRRCTTCRSARGREAAQAQGRLVLRLQSGGVQGFWRAGLGHALLHGRQAEANGKNTKNDGSFVGMSEIVGTPVFFKDRVYVAIGRDPEHGRGRGALHCIDATGSGDITRTGRIWTYQGLDRTLSTVSIADGLLYVCDVAGRCIVSTPRAGNATGSTKPMAPHGVPRWSRTARFSCRPRKAWLS